MANTALALQAMPTRCKTLYKTATDSLSEFRLGTGEELKRIETTRRRAASSCNALAIATFSSQPSRYTVSLATAHFTADELFRIQWQQQATEDANILDVTTLLQRLTSYDDVTLLGV